MKHLLSILPSRCVSSATGYEVKTKGPGAVDALHCIKMVNAHP
jgi:hypothetical protein